MKGPGLEELLYLALDWSLEELESRLGKESGRHRLLVAGFLRETGVAARSWLKPIAEYSRRALENWEDPVNFILPSDKRKATELRSAGNALFGHRSFALAIGKYKKALSHDPNDHFSLNNLALCYARVGQWNSSWNYAQAAISVVPDFSKAWLRYAQACDKLNAVVMAAFGFRMAHWSAKTQMDAKQQKYMLKLSEQFEKRSKLSATQLEEVTRLCKGKMINELQMLAPFSRDLLSDQNYLSKKHSATMQRLARVSLAKVLIPKLPAQNPSERWTVSWASTDDFDGRYDDESGDGASVCGPMHLTYADRVESHVTRSFVIHITSAKTWMSLYSRAKFGVPDAHRIVDALMHAIVAPLSPNIACVPSGLWLCSRMRHESEDVKTLLRQKTGREITLFKEPMEEVTRYGYCWHPYGWNHKIN